MHTSKKKLQEKKEGMEEAWQKIEVQSGGLINHYYISSLIWSNSKGLALGIGNMTSIESGNEVRGFAVDARLSSPTSSVFIAWTYSSSNINTTVVRVGIVSAATRKAGLEYVAEGEDWRGLSHLVLNWFL